MRTTDVEMILETYDEAEDKNKAILNLAQMLKVTPGEIVEKLEKNGREIRIKTKQETKKEDPVKEVKREMGGHVQDVLFKEIAYLERHIDELKTELAKAEADYKEITEFVFSFNP